jgi:hypothetical protein
MKIFTQATGEYLELATKYMVPKLQDDVNLHIISKNELALPGLTHKAEFHELNIDRLELWHDMLVANKGEKVLLLDCDVTFHAPFVEDLSDLLDENEFLFQSCDGEVTGFNAGIIAVVSNEATIGLYREWVDRARATPPHGRIDNTFPENICKDLLNEGKEAGTIKASGLPYRYGFLGPDTKIYHAINGGFSCMSKEFILEMSFRYVQGTHQFDPTVDPTGGLPEFVQRNWDKDWLGDASKIGPLNIVYVGSMPLLNWEKLTFQMNVPAEHRKKLFYNSSGEQRGIWKSGLDACGRPIEPPGFRPVSSIYALTQDSAGKELYQIRCNAWDFDTTGDINSLIEASMDPALDIRFVHIWTLGTGWGSDQIGFFTEFYYDPITGNRAGEQTLAFLGPASP